MTHKKIVIEFEVEPEPFNMTQDWVYSAIRRQMQEEARIGFVEGMRLMELHRVDVHGGD